jgi:hypothetical protein
LIAFGLYWFTLAPTVLEADGGEFQFVPWLPGIAHPTGYPLYVLLGWLWTHLLPIGEVAWRMNLLSAVLAAATVGLVYAVARRMLDLTLPETPDLARLLAAVIAAATWAVSHTFWTQAIIAEVYALHALLVATILWLVVYYPLTSAPFKTGAWLAFLIGLSLTHHRTSVLLLPAVVVYLWRIYRPASLKTADGRQQTAPKIDSDLRLRHLPPIRGMKAQPKGSVVGGCRWPAYAALLAAPLLLYLYLPLIAPYTPYATFILSDNQKLILYDNSLTGFWDHITASVFSDELQPTAAGWDRLRLAGELLRQQIGWVGIGLALAGLVTLQRRQLNLLWLTGLAFLAFVAFNLVYFIGDVFVLFIPAWLVVCLWVGLGSLGLAHWLANTLVKSKTGQVNSSPVLEAMDRNLGQRIYHLLVICFTALGLLLPLFLGLTHYTEVNQAHNTAASQRWQAILAQPLPVGAVLLSNDRNEMMPLWYYQYVEGRRPDVLGLFPLITPQSEYRNIGRVLDEALASSRPVYLIKPIEGLSLKADLSPAGNLWRAEVNTAPPGHPLNVSLPKITITANPIITETISLLGYDLQPTSIKSGDSITVTLHWQLTQPLTLNYSSYVHLVNRDDQGLTQSDHRPGGDYYPSSLWQVGEVLRDQHHLVIPANLPPGRYRLRAGLYYQPRPGVIAGMGQGVDLGSIVVD